MTDEQKQQMMSQKSNFDIYADKGVQAKQDLEAAGFTGIKIWEQPINIMYRNGEEFMAKFGDQRCIPQGKAWGFSDEKIQEMRSETIDLFDQLTGSKTSDLKTF